MLLSQWAGSIFSSQLVLRLCKPLAKLNQCSICGNRLRTPHYLGRNQQSTVNSYLDKSVQKWRKLASNLVIESNTSLTEGKGRACSGWPNSIFPGQLRFPFFRFSWQSQAGCHLAWKSSFLWKLLCLGTWLLLSRPLTETVLLPPDHLIIDGDPNHPPGFWHSGLLKHSFGISGQLDCYLLVKFLAHSKFCLLLASGSLIFPVLWFFSAPVFLCLMAYCLADIHCQLLLPVWFFFNLFLQSTTIVLSPRTDIFRA